MSGKISVVIPVKNGEDKIERCLEAVFNQTLKPYEVIVVDGHSIDKTVEIVQKFPVRIFYENYGTRGGACQVGLGKAMGRYVAFTDADCIPKKGWLENLIKEFGEGIVGGGGVIQDASAGIWGKTIGFALNTFIGSARSVQGRVFRNKRFVKSISGCNSMYRKEDLENVGGFNVKISVNEDTELNKRLLSIGKLLYTPNAVVIHKHDRRLAGFGKRMYEYGYGRGRNRLWDLQVIPSLLFPFLIISLIVTPWIFLVTSGIYFAALIIMGLKFGYQERSVKCFLLLLLVYIIEHSSYAAGFWKGILEGILQTTLK